MTTILILLILTEAIMIVAMLCVALWLHHKIGIFKDQQRKWAVTPSWDSLEFALRAIRRFNETFYNGGNYRLAAATMHISRYMKQIRWLAKKAAEEGDGAYAKSLEESKIKEIGYEYKRNNN